eukprot:scaffold259143_cov21-Prasinocladus_malaysianus.AAC.1
MRVQRIRNNVCAGVQRIPAPEGLRCHVLTDDLTAAGNAPDTQEEGCLLGPCHHQAINGRYVSNLKKQQVAGLCMDRIA